jgi:putative hydrolase of the HAD superfamily
VNRRPICFDATGTLIELSESVGEVYRRIALDHGVDLPAWRLDDAYRRILERAPIRGVDGDTLAEREGAEVKWWSERIRETFQATDSTVRFDDFSSFATALFDVYRRAGAWRLRAGAVEMLTRLREQKRPMAIVSNFDHRLPDLLEVLGISRFFSVLNNLGIPTKSRGSILIIGFFSYSFQNNISSE